MSDPYEIIATPLTLWLAPVGTAFALIDVAPASPWAKVGTNGTLSEDEAGVTVTHSQSLQEVHTGGSTGPVKVFRDKEGLKLEVTILDVSLEQYKASLNGNTITTTAAATGTAGFKKIGLSRGQNVTLYALLARGASPYADSMNAQYQVPRCYQSGDPVLVYKKGVPAGLKLEFAVLEDPTAASADVRLGTLVTQHQVAL